MRSQQGSYIDKCGYDQAGVILQQIYGALTLPASNGPSGTLVRFNQSEFTFPAAPADYSMGEHGFLYVPDNCAGGAICRVHVALHGCKQSSDNSGEEFVRHAGYNQ